MPYGKRVNRAKTMHEAQKSIHDAGARLERRLSERAAAGGPREEQELKIANKSLQLWSVGLDLMTDELVAFERIRKAIRAKTDLPDTVSLLKNIKDVSECVKAGRDCTAVFVNLLADEIEETRDEERDARLRAIYKKITESSSEDVRRALSIPKDVDAESDLLQ